MSTLPSVAVVGAGPAGLMAAEVLAQGGATVHVFDAMPSVGRKFLLAGRGGLNLTHAEPLENFLSRYGEREAALAPAVNSFNPLAQRSWAAGLGIETFVGSSGRVFPADMKAAPLLRAWLHRLRAGGVVFHKRQRWQGWAQNGALCFASPAGSTQHHADATVLALGGASWPRLAPTAPGCRSCKHAAWRWRRSNLPTVALTWVAAGAPTCASALPASPSNPWPRASQPATAA